MKRQRAASWAAAFIKMGAFRAGALCIFLLAAICLIWQDAVDLEADNFDDIDDEKLMARTLGHVWFTLARFRS